MTVQNRVPFLRVQRLFPHEAQPLSVEMDRSYTDIANAVNNRVIGLFALATILANGKTWSINGLSYAGLTALYRFNGPGSYPHNINNFFATSPACYGTYTDGSNWYGAIFGSNVPIAGQVSFYVTTTNIVILAGAGAPSITTIYIVLDWLSQA